MITYTAERLPMRALIVSDELNSETAAGRAVRALVEDLRGRQVEVVHSVSAADACALVVSDPSIQCALLDWDLRRDGGTGQAISVIETIRARNATLPVFLLAERSLLSEIPLDAVERVNDFIWLLEDTPEFLSGRIVNAIQRYRDQLVPPMFRALVQYARVYEYSWHTPGHTGGTAFLKSPVGRAFFSFFGEELFRSDLSISVGELGSLLDHSGPIGEGERYAARVFGAHRSYTVTNGTSTSNRVVLSACVTRDQVALCDRNCHKSVEHSMTLSGAIPTYLMPERNRYGLTGPIRPENLSPSAVSQAIAANRLVGDGIDPAPVHAIITNSTYDGLCYHVGRVEELLGQSVDRLHFDEAWFGYARFNPIYRDRFAMRGQPSGHTSKQPTIFAVQSTHKLLAALSQASFIHIRDGRKPIDHERFNEAFMMHASTSPQYAIIASNEISAAMMDGQGGAALTGESIHEAVAFRKMIARMNAEFGQRSDWFFKCWQPDIVRDPADLRELPFHNAADDMLAKDAGCWVLHPDQNWHGFRGLEDGYCMLDPIKVSILTPGMADDGKLGANGIPATILSAYLDHLGIQVEKTTDFTILLLFSIGITKGKWGTLVDALLQFKRDYDANSPLERTIPALLSNHPSRYFGMGLRDLASEMFEAMRKRNTTEHLARGFSVLPHPDASPVRAYEALVRGKVKRVTLEEAAGRTVATGIVPYPPGIPLLMPGENAGSADGPAITYLKDLEAFDRHFPGFAHETHGIEVRSDRYTLLCID